MSRYFIILCLFLVNIGWAERSVDIEYQLLKDSPNKIILDALDERELIIYKAMPEKFTVTIFTDIFCPFCRDLHVNIGDFLDNGITVRYAPFPLREESYAVLESIWCANNREEMLDIAMIQLQFKENLCGNELVNKYNNVARELKVMGTPSIFFEDGRKVSGFMTAKEINQILMGQMNIDEWKRPNK